MASEFSSKCLNLNVSDGRKLWVTLELADDGLRGTSTNKHANAHARALFMHMYSNGVNSSILHMLLVQTYICHCVEPVRHMIKTEHRDL